MNEVWQKLQDARRESIAEDTDFAHVCRAARPAFNGEKLRKAATGTSRALILRLLDPAPLDRGERVTLAELLAGLMHTTGKPALGAAVRESDRLLLAEAHARARVMHDGGMPTATARTAASEWAAADPRARNRDASTILRQLRRIRL